MAKIVIVDDEDEKSRGSTETIEVRAWDLGGARGQPFYIGSGANFSASGNIWIEIIYSVEGAQVFYTRNFLHLGGFSDSDDPSGLLEKMKNHEAGTCFIGSMLPETYVEYKIEDKTYQAGDETHSYKDYTFEIGADVGAVFGFSSPGMRWIKIRLDDVGPEEGVRFMRELTLEIEAVRDGKHPDPASLPPGSSEWPLIWQLNQKAYDQLAEEYQDDYFDLPALAEAFDGWMNDLRPFGKVLDAGCGHGDPVISRLLERGFQVIGTDFSSQMLAKASQKFPQVEFVQAATTQLSFETLFDGACSFSSLLYMDPIDFYHAIYRLYCALKPGGLLFLYGYDNGPDWRGEPFSTVMKQWMWSWHYGMEEAANRLEEHGYFKLLEMKQVYVDPKAVEEYAQKLEEEKHKKEEYERKIAENPSGFNVPYPSVPVERPSYAYVLIAQRAA